MYHLIELYCPKGSPVSVGVTMHIISISSISAVQMVCCFWYVGNCWHSHLPCLPSHRTSLRTFIFAKHGAIRDFPSNHDQALKLCLLVQKFRIKFGFQTHFLVWWTVDRCIYIHLFSSFNSPPMFNLSKWKISSVSYGHYGTIKLFVYII